VGRVGAVWGRNGKTGGGFIHTKQEMNVDTMIIPTCQFLFHSKTIAFMSNFVICDLLSKFPLRDLLSRNYQSHLRRSLPINMPYYRIYRSRPSSRTLFRTEEMDSSKSKLQLSASADADLDSVCVCAGGGKRGKRGT